jgi:hypothetical protein
MATQSGMRQVHGAIEHLKRGDFKCALTLAATGAGILPPTDEPQFRRWQQRASSDEVVHWLDHDEVLDRAHGTYRLLELMPIEEVKATALIYRVKFDAFFGDPPQVINLRICARPRLRSLESNEVMPAAWRIARLPLS